MDAFSYVSGVTSIVLALGIALTGWNRKTHGATRANACVLGSPHVGGQRLSIS